MRLEALTKEARDGSARSAASARTGSEDPAVLEAELDAARELALAARSNGPTGAAQSKASAVSAIAALDALAESTSSTTSVTDSAITKALDAARIAIRKTLVSAAALSKRAGIYKEIQVRVCGC